KQAFRVPKQPVVHRRNRAPAICQLGAPFAKRDSTRRAREVDEERAAVGKILRGDGCRTQMWMGRNTRWSPLPEEGKCLHRGVISKNFRIRGNFCLRSPSVTVQPMPEGLRRSFMVT